jgi:hypothetical protein
MPTCLEQSASRPTKFKMAVLPPGAVNIANVARPGGTLSLPHQLALEDMKSFIVKFYISPTKLIS